MSLDSLKLMFEFGVIPVCLAAEHDSDGMEDIKMVETFSVGRLCIKTAGRDSDRRCVVVEAVDAKHVVIDGETRRRKVNIAHLEPLDKVFKLGIKASRNDIKVLFKKEFGIELKDTKPKKTGERPKHQKVKKAKPAKQPAKATEVKKEVKQIVKPADKAAKTAAESKA